MPEARIRNADAHDLKALLPVIEVFHGHEHIPWNEAVVRGGLDALRANPAHGRLLLIERGEVLAGYIVVTFCFGLEFGGRYALLDELYVLPSQRGGGIGRLALDAVEALARSEGLQVVRLEVSDDNPHARDIYSRRGYVAHPRRLMTRWLDR